MEMIPQGYALYAAVDFDEEGKPCLCMVVGWEQVTGSQLVPMVVSIGDDPDGDATFGRAERAAAEGDAVRYIGPDRAAAQNHVNGGVRATQAPRGRGTVERYARGATALCGLHNAHESHLWTPDGHDYPIACTGAPA